MPETGNNMIIILPNVVSKPQILNCVTAVQLDWDCVHPAPGLAVNRSIYPGFRINFFTGHIQTDHVLGQKWYVME